MKRSVIISVAAAVAFFAVVLAVSLHVFRGNAVRVEGSLYVPTGADFATLEDSLRVRLRHLGAFRAYSARLGLSDHVKPGHYMLRRGMSVLDLGRMLNLGEQTPIDVVVRQYRLPGTLASRIGAQLEADSASIHASMRDPEILKKYGFDSDLELFSIFIPNTYEMWWTDSPADFIARMKREYDRFWNPARREKLTRTRLTPMQVISLAAILDEETNREDEMPTVAGVYINRLRSGMPLQADPTVKYALGDFTIRRILYKHLKVDSPYNTYRVRGLPPTPIIMPSIAAIDAVLDFREHNYIYFCAREDFSGYHNFAATYSEHMRNARRYGAELNRRGIK